jgi:ectoine hydroxylase-related dioxygenase (phytanoyl-CoA dioxygenase family)
MAGAVLHRQPAASPGVIWGEELGRAGYCIIPDLLAPAKIAALHRDLAERLERTPFCDGDFYGRRTKRFGGLLKRSPHAEALVTHPTILAIAEHVLGPFCDRFQVNLSQAISIHPGEAAQPPHRDQDMWAAPKGQYEYLLNVIWPFTPFTAENGATVLYPGSHGAALDDPVDTDAAVAAEMDPGSALVFLGSTLHGGGANRTFTPRTGVCVSYCLGWLKPYENQWLVYPPQIARTFSPQLAALIGYQQHRPNLGNYEGRCPSILFDAAPDEYLNAVDALTPDQATMLRQFKAAQNQPAAPPLALI